MKRWQAAFGAVIIFTAGFYGGYRFAEPDTIGLPPVATAPPEASPPESVTLNSDDAERTRRLREALLRANEEISQLESWNESLARQIERLDLPLPGDTTYTDLLARVDRLPPGLIRQQLRYLFDDDYVDGIENPNDLAKELIEIALRENEDIEDDDESPALRVGVEFSLSPVRGVRTFYDLDEVDAYDRIFAHFAASQPYANLIVRWQHRTTGEILQFESLQLGASQEIYRSMRPPNGWKSGQYQVSLYDLNNDRKLVGSNSYQISSVINPPSGEIAESQADQDVINDLVSSGKAVSKSF